MKAKRLDFFIPTTYILLYIIFMTVVSFVIDNNTQGYSEIYGLIYSTGFFMTHPFYSYLLGLLFVAPLPLLIYAVIKKRNDLIVDFSISAAISIVLIILIIS